MPTPVILINGNQPPPLGTVANGTFALNSTLNLSIQDTTNIVSVVWGTAQKPVASTVALSSPTSFTPTLGPLDFPGIFAFILTATYTNQTTVSVEASVLVPSVNHSVPLVPVTLGALNNSVANLTALRLLAFNAYNAVNMLGYATPGDGGGGVFAWSSTSVAADNGGTVIIPTGQSAQIAGRWVRQYSGPVDVRWFGAVADGATNMAPALQASHDLLPAEGGTISLPPGAYSVQASVTFSKNVHLKLDGAQVVGSVAASPIFIISGANFTCEGTDRASASITSATNGEIFQLKGTFPQNGSGVPHINVSRVSLLGGSGTSKALDTSVARVPALAFNEGMLKFEECLLSNFGGTAITFGTSVYYGRIQDCQFRANASSLFIGDNSDVIVHHNEFIQGTGTQITVLGPDVMINDNKFLGNGGSPSSSPDILFDPKVNATEGYAWVLNNKFGAENETFNARPRVQAFDVATPTNICGPVVVSDNRFGGPGPRTIASISLTGNVVTVVMSSAHGLATGARVGIAQVSNVVFNIAATATVVNATTFTYPLTHADIAAIVNSGVVQLLNGPAIQLKSPINRWGFFSNLFEQYGLIVDDSQPQPTTGLSPAPERRDTFGKNRFGRQFIKAPYDYGVTLFKNGGMHFEYVARQEAEEGFGDWRPREAAQLINRVAASDDFTQADWLKSGVAIATGQTDPWGGTTAQLWTRAGLVLEEFVGQIISTSNLGSRIVVRLLAKAGTLDNLTTSLVDTTSNTILGWEQVNLSTTYKWYEVVFNNINPAHAFEVEFYPGGTEDILAGTVVVAQVLVCDDERQDYLPTTHSSGALLRSDASGRFDREVMISRIRASEFGPAGTAPAIGATSGFGTGPTITIVSGSQDLAGKVSWVCGTQPGASGSVVVNFGKAFSGNAPVVLVSFEDTGSGGYIHAQVGSVGTGSFTIEWENVSVGVALPNAYAGKFSWIAIAQ